MNYTIDDTDTDISYSLSPPWTTQSPADPDLASFFDSTYHVASADGASFNITFGGSAVYIYGSKGPGHANYDIVYDGTLLQGLSASSASTAFQQPLFAYTFAPTADTHFVELTVLFDGDNTWFDVDYITITTPSGQNTTTPASTLPNLAPTAPWATPSPPSQPSITPIFLPTPSPPSSSSSSNNLPLPSILAILFGTLTFLALLLATALWVLNRRKPALSRSSSGSGKPYPGGPYSRAAIASPSSSQARFLESALSVPYAWPARDPRHLAPSYLTAGSEYSQASAATAVWTMLSPSPGALSPSLSGSGFSESSSLRTDPPLSPNRLIELPPAPLSPNRLTESPSAHSELLVPPSPIRFAHSVSSFSSLKGFISPKKKRAKDADSTKSNFLQV